MPARLRGDGAVCSRQRRMQLPEQAVFCVPCIICTSRVISEESALDTNDQFDSFDLYERYQERYGDLYDEQPVSGRRSRKPNARSSERPAESAAMPETAAPEITYQPSRFERGWLMNAVYPFFVEQLITDVLYHVRGGKEASVYCCRADPSTDAEVLAAKVYRPSQFRSLRNDALYREGRDILTAQGRAMLGDRGRSAQKPDARMMRAVAGKSAFGKEILQSSWLSYEFMFMERLFRAGASVPKPYACVGNAVLMSFIGDQHGAAPALQSVRLAAHEAQGLFEEIMRTVEMMLAEGYIHGDLSAYNVLYWDGKAVVIDFPQVTNSERNVHARAILERDVERICSYFARQGVESDPQAITADLWARYVAQ